LRLAACGWGFAGRRTPHTASRNTNLLLDNFPIKPYLADFFHHTEITVMKRLLLLCALALSALSVTLAQDGDPLEGRWEGVITKNGIHSTEGYKFELFIKVNNGIISGRSYIHLSDRRIVQMDVSGTMYGDRSVYLEDINFITAEGDDFVPPFARKYQFIHNRSIFDSSLEGYWQQIIKDPLNNKRERGRIVLKKIKSKV
jgi:hypothetical protein